MNKYTIYTTFCRNTMYQCPCIISEVIELDDENDDIWLPTIPDMMVKRRIVVVLGSVNSDFKLSGITSQECQQDLPCIFGHCACVD